MRMLSLSLWGIGLAICLADALRHYRTYRQTNAPQARSHLRLALYGAGILLVGQLVVWCVYL